jgi:SWI/SNF chromatin-remodeling complex subunit SWI1
MDSSELLAAFDSKPIASDVQFNEGYEVGPSTPPSKRVRYRVEYAPYHRDLETYGGWDLRTIVKETEWSDQSRECLMVDDLGQVDIESLCMSVRSRLQSEVTYALTVLDMLSMPGKGEDKGGLGLMHCGDLLSDLVDLVEEEAFGEGGWMAWISTNEGMRQSDNSSLANSHQALLDISAEQDVLPVLFGNRGELECRAETVLVAVNLLRNFSLMNDNHPILVKHPRFMEVMLRVCDLRLAFTVKDVVSSLRVSDVLRLREDVLDILHGLSANIDLGLLPHDATEALFDLLLSHLRDCQSGNVLERLLAGSTDEMDLSERPRLALEVLSQLSSTDHNRRILRLLPADKLLDAFFTCLRYLAFNSPDIAVICTQPGALDVQGKLAVCLYNLAFLAPLQIRTVIREQTGVMMTISLALQIHGNLPPHPSYGLILRRLGETIGVLNGPDDLVGEGRILTFGANASARGLRGLQDSKTLVAPGILAQREDQLLFDMLQTGRRSGDLDQVAFGELTRAIWAI